MIGHNLGSFLLHKGKRLLEGHRELPHKVGNHETRRAGDPRITVDVDHLVEVEALFDEVDSLIEK